MTWISLPVTRSMQQARTRNLESIPRAPHVVDVVRQTLSAR